MKVRGSGTRPHARRRRRLEPSGHPPHARADPGGSRLDPSLLRRAVVVAVVLAGLVRLAAGWNDLWLDEIWTVNLVGGLDSPLGVFALRHDNNHVLNTLFVYALRPFGIDWLYRAPAWIAGVAVVALGARVAWLGEGTGDAGDAPPMTRALVAAVLLGGAYLLVHYGSEARGYSLALAFGLLALATALRDGLRPMSRRAPVMWASLVLAMLGHALAVHMLAALVAWSALRAFHRGGWRDAGSVLAWWYAVPVAAYALFYWTILRGITVGGGPRDGALAPLARAVGATTGLPAGTPAPLLLAVAVAVLALGIAWLAARRSDQWALYLVGIAVSPAALAVVHPTDLYAERYFVVSATLWLLLAARLLAWLTTRGPAATGVVAVTLAAFLVSNALRIGPLVRDGRGRFRDALRYMARHTPDGAVTVTSDHDFRNRMIVEYYAPRIETETRIRYVDRANLTVPGPEWYVAHLPPPAGIVARSVTDARGNPYTLAAEFAANPFAGLPWRLYRRAAAP